VDDPVHDPIWLRLEDQIAWYDANSTRNQRAFKRLKYIEIAAAATIPVVSGFGTTRIVAAVLGGVVLAIEAILHLNQYQQNWLTYRSTAEALKHEKFLYLARAGHYQGAADGHGLLAERVEALVSQEHSKWLSVRQDQEAEHGAATTA
jgi:hypothetical protein